MLNINIQFQTIHNDPNLVAHLAPEDRLALHLALLLSSVAALLDRLLAALASILKHGQDFTGIIASHFIFTTKKDISEWPQRDIMSTDRLATLLPRLVVARKSCVCSTLAGLHGAGNLHHGGDDDGDDKEGDGGGDH